MGLIQRTDASPLTGMNQSSLTGAAGNEAGTRDGGMGA